MSTKDKRTEQFRCRGLNAYGIKGYTPQGHKVNRGVASTVRQKDISGRGQNPLSLISFCFRNGVRSTIVVSRAEAMPGNFAPYPDATHVGLIVGRNAAGKLLVCHCSYGMNNVGVTEFSASGFTAVGKLSFMG